MSEEQTQLAVVSGGNSTLLLPITTTNEMIERHNAVTEYLNSILKQDRDYGAIPGTGDRMTLLKPGAELILTGFGCMAIDEVIQSDSDHNAEIKYSLDKWVACDVPKVGGRQDDDEIARRKLAGTHRWKKNGNKFDYQEKINESGVALGFYRYVIRTKIVHRQTGEVVGSGIGSCSTAESKYIRQPRDAENTVLKMAKKRALIDAVLSTFSLSERFSQDMDELMENKEARTAETTKAKDTKAKEEKPKTSQEVYWEAHASLKLPPITGVNVKFKPLNLEMMNGLLGTVVTTFEEFTDEQWTALTAKVLALTDAEIGDWKSAAAGVK